MFGESLLSTFHSITHAHTRHAKKAETQFSVYLQDFRTIMCKIQLPFELQICNAFELMFVECHCCMVCRCSQNHATKCQMKAQKANIFSRNWILKIGFNVVLECGMITQKYTSIQLEIQTKMRERYTFSHYNTQTHIRTAYICDWRIIRNVEFTNFCWCTPTDFRRIMRLSEIQGNNNNSNQI